MHKRNDSKPAGGRSIQGNNAGSGDRLSAGFERDLATLSKISTSDAVPERRHPSTELVRIDALHPARRNARQHSKDQIRAIANSIRRFGFTNPVLVQRDLEIIAGHGRWEAAKLLGMKKVPVLRLEGWSKADIRAYAIADNRLAEQATWDNEILLEQIDEILLEVADYDVTLTGFSAPELDELRIVQERAGGQVESDPAADTLPGHVEGEAISERGDLWRLGPHRLVVGSALEPASYRLLLGRRKADAVISDPPYNVRIEGFVSGKGKRRHGDFVMGAGEMSAGEFREWLATFLAVARGACIPQAAFHVFIDWRHFADLQRAAEQSSLKLASLCVWVKPRGGMGSLYRSQHELVGVFCAAGQSMRNNVQLGRHGRNRTNVWHYDGPSSLTREGQAALDLHPTVKPVALIADAMLDVTPVGGLVLDPFSGSGTVFISATKAKRIAAGIELDPAYADIALRRYEAYTGETPILDATGEDFRAVLRRRLAERGHDRRSIDDHPALQVLRTPERPARTSVRKGGKR
jgi:DNA modification methylase